MADASTEFLRSLARFAVDAERELELAQHELSELDRLVGESAVEIEQLAEQGAAVDNRLRLLDVTEGSPHLDEIRALYAEAYDLQRRLAELQRGADVLEERRHWRGKSLEELRRFLDLIQAASQPVPASDDSERLLEHGTPQRLLVRIIEAQERERGHLARQMHDGPAQSLTNLILQAEICERLFSSHPERARVELVNLKSAAHATFQTIRDFILDLRPMILDDLGLVPTIRRYVSALQAKSRAEISFEPFGLEQRLPTLLEITTFRALQELLGNADRHANAGRIAVTLDLGADRIVAIVEDDGQGFDVSRTLTKTGSRALGLTTLRERLEMLDGRIDIQSAPDQGTRVRVEIPVPSSPLDGVPASY